MKAIRVAGRAPTSQELREARRLDELASNTLLRVRESAERWRNGALGMIGIIAAVTLLKGPTSISSVPPGWKVAVLSLAAGAVAAAILSLILAMLASFGWPSPERFTAVSRLAEWEAGEVRRTVARLRWSMFAALVFVALFVGGLGVSALAPATKPQIEVVRKDGTAYCGDRLSITDGAFTLRTRGVDVQLPADTIGAVRAAHCRGP